ncbi:MAG: DNA gyrase/topoisomerase IV subunit A [Lachnospiraceae bacterium]|jgi:DNA gyrase subunit A
MAEQIVSTEYSDVMQKSYIDYSMSVITSRAVPDVRDGLKPVQRRVLYAMQQLGLSYDKPHRKSARIVGDAMGKYHPHGDSSIYETLVVMAQGFKKAMPLVDGHGNFGSIEGDGAAAMRYTEARLTKFAQDVYLSDLDKNVVDFVPNFDETEREPEVLPVRVPNILVNGADGIAVGMVTNVPTHNLAEVCDAECAYLDGMMKGKELTTKELLHYCKGPDFPTGGIVINRSELEEIYRTGTGKIKIRGKVQFEKAKKRGEHDRLVITEIPYTMIGSGIGKFIHDVVDLIESRQASDVLDITNASSKEGIRIVLELKKNADVDYLENLLYKKTKLEDTFGVNTLAIVDGRPQTLGLGEILKCHLNFRFELAKRKYETLLKKEEEVKEVREGLIRAVDCIDLIIEVLRGSKNITMAKECLMHGKTEGIRFKSAASRKAAGSFSFTERQASAILEMRMYRLIGLEIDQLKKEYQDSLDKIAKYERILNSKTEMAKVIREDLQKIKKTYGCARRTVIEDGKQAVLEEKKMEEQEVCFLMDRFGYAKTIDMAAYERNIDAIQSKYRYCLTILNTDRIGVFTDTGKYHQIKVSDIPFGRFKDKGTPLDNLGNYDSSGEEILLLEPRSILLRQSLLFVTEKGMLKLVKGSEFDTQMRTVVSTKLTDGDRIIQVLPTDAESVSSSHFNEDGTISEELSVESAENVILQTEENYMIRFRLSEVAFQKKNAIGVHGIRLGAEDKVCDVYLISGHDETIVRVGSRDVHLERLKISHRGGKGVRQK